MTYPNLVSAADHLGKKLHTFAGHSIDATHTSYCFDQMARGIDYINREPSAKAVSFDAIIYVSGKALPVIVTVEGTDISKPVDVAIQFA
jgi:hypothetical protein